MARSKINDKGEQIFYPQEKTAKDVEFWTNEMIVEYDKFIMNEKLHWIDTNYTFEESSWNPTKIQAFIAAVNKIFIKTFPFKAKLSWDMKKNAEQIPVLEATIRTNEHGSLGVEMPIAKIRSPKCPKNLPEALIENFIKNFNKKIP
jgi:hypothetical protein